MLNFIGWVCFYGFMGGVSVALCGVVFSTNDAEIENGFLVASAIFWPFFLPLWSALGLAQLGKSAWTVWKNK